MGADSDAAPPRGAPPPLPACPDVRVISLTDGRMCYLDPARAKKPLPPGQAVAFASVSPQPKFPVRVPLGWETMHETDLRRHVEAHVLAARNAPPPSTPAPVARRRGWLR